MTAHAPREKLAIVDGLRTPFCKMGGPLARLAADELARQAVVALLAKTGIPTEAVDEVIFGCVAQPFESANIARVIALRACLPEGVPASTVNRNCASGLEAITSACERMHAGRGSAFVVGGTENMSRIPFYLPHETAEKLYRFNRAKDLPAKLEAISAFRPADLRVKSGLLAGLTDPVSDLNMGETAEVLVRDYEITREAQDEFALRSHWRAALAKEARAQEITPVYLPDGSVVEDDNGVRENQTLEALAKLMPVFDRHLGTVTAGNASQVTDGAVALLVMGERRARELGLKPLGYLTDYAYAGCEPRRMGLGPCAALKRLSERGVEWKDADLFEINEAFAGQVLAVLAELKRGGFTLDEDRLNVNGGAIAIGHPVGASGARLVLTALKELQRRNARKAVVSLCIGGGQGAAMVLESNPE